MILNYYSLFIDNIISSWAKSTILLNIFLLEVNFDKFTIKLHLLISSMFAKFLEN